MRSIISTIWRRTLLLLFTLSAPLLAYAQDNAEAAVGIDKRIDEAFKPVADAIAGVVFYSIKVSGSDLPIVLIILISGALYFTLYFMFPNIRYLGLSIRTVKGDYEDATADTAVTKTADFQRTDILDDNPDTIRDESAVAGEVTPFQALTAALSATVGLGNIAGVAVALSLGGPGATF